MTTLNSKILKVQQIFNDIADAIKVKLNIEDWEEECIGPEDYARKILEINTCDHSDNPPAEESEITMDVTGDIEFSFDNNLKRTITVTYKNCDSINNPRIVSVARNVSWLNITNTEIDSTGTIYTYTLEAEQNNGNERRANVVFSCIKGENEISKTITVIQRGYFFTSGIVLSNSGFEISSDAKDLEISAEYRYIDIINEVNCSESWIRWSLTSVDEHEHVVQKKYSFSISSNEYNTDRLATIIFSGIGMDGEKYEKSCIIKQSGKPTSEPEEPLYIKATPMVINFGGDFLQQEVIVTTNSSSYNISEPPDWLTVTRNNNGVTLEAKPNTDVNPKDYELIFTCSEDSSVNATCGIRLAGRKLIDAEIGITENQLNVSAAQSTIYKIVYTRDTTEVNENGYDFWVEGHASWLGVKLGTISESDDSPYRNTQVVITIEANDSLNERNGSITFACIGESGKKTVDVSVTQAAKEVVEPVDKKIVVWTTEDDRYIEDGVGLKGVTVRYENCTIDEVLDPVLSPTVDWLSFNNKSVYPSTHPSVGLNNVLIDYAFKFTHDENIKEPTNCDVNFGISNNEDLTQTYTFTHIPTTSISCTTNSLVFSDVASEKNIIVTTKNTIDSDKESEIWVENSPEWANITLQEGQNVGESFNRNVLVSVLKNGGEERTGTITFACLGINGEKRINIPITQRAKEIVPEEPLSIYYGYIPYDSSIEPATWKSEGFNLITEEWILDGVTNGNITKEDAGSMDKTSFGVVPKNSFLLIAVPSGEYVATMDNGIGGKVKFSVSPYSNGEYTVTIDGIAYSLYGEYTSINYPEDSTFFYID